MSYSSRRTGPKWGRIFLVSGVAIAAVSISQAHEVEDNGPKVERSFDLTGFDAIDISGVYDVEIKVGDDYAIHLKGPEREMEYARVEVNGGRLELGQREKRRWGNRKGIDAYVTVPSLRALNVTGVSDVDVQGVQTARFDLDVSGVADIEITGNCETLNADITGVTDIDASDFTCEHGDIDMSGVGDLSVHTSLSVDADVSGVGDVVVYGRPESVEKSVSKYTASLEIK